MCAYSASSDWLCCAASMCAEPPGPRNTTGSVNCPPDIWRILAALLIDLIDRDEREVPGHELDDRPQADHRGADADADEAALGDRRVDDALLAELLAACPCDTL